MNADENEVKALFAMEEGDFLKMIGAKALDEGFGAAEAADEEKEAEGRRIVEQLKPARPEGLCSHPVVLAFIANAKVELGADIVGVVGDVLCHTVLVVPPVTLTVAFIRFGLRKYCGHT